MRSMMLYGAPVWASDAMASRRIKQLLRRLERRMAIRVIRGYRTISYVAVQALAGEIPSNCRLPALFGGFRRSQRWRRSRNSKASPGHIRLALATWRLELSSHAGERVAGALLPHLKRWRERRHGRLTCRATQVFTGHGCFGVYLCRIGKEAAAACHHCGEEEDSAQHTLEECPAFSSMPNQA
ncbi:uncharacterized protein LOC128882410 [Hylaeus volcanicus]|uniref:uncharacterized protein LOC128882410 n=1 Tax=Hylaeus volcanicus TaxID=313075 RepID=UPI0023B7E4AC|nr:uncharacterized protein LOC128882410 [Hylaeus volcanicus]